MHQNFKYSTKLNMMVKVIKLFTGVLGKRSPDDFIGKHLCRTISLNKVSPLHAKQRLMHMRRCFPVSFTKYFKMLSEQKTSGWLLLVNTFLFVTSTSARKNVSLDIDFFIFTFFISEKTKAATGDVLWKNVFPQVSQIQKHLSWGLFLIKLEVFQNTYFEEHLWTNASKKINICLIFK